MKESETHPLLEVLQKQQANIHSIYPEDLEQTHAGPVLDASVSMSLYDPCLADSVPSVLLESSISSDS